MAVQLMRLAIANRGEVAVRILRACEELQIEAVLLHSRLDANSLAARLAPFTIELNGTSLKETYLNSSAVIAAAREAKCDLLHPGFGFLSEQSEFAAAVSAAGIRFVGPNAEAMRRLGNKSEAKRLAQKLKIATVPALLTKGMREEQLLHEAKALGFPLLIKAAAGGGGKGMKLVQQPSEFSAQLASAKREALNAFGSDEVLLEQALSQARHLEVQLFGDSRGNLVHLGVRDCSLQRRYQKVIEESAQLSAGLEKKLTHAALKLVDEVGYQSAATVEFLVAKERPYFMEVNTRLQVEHPVTEMTYRVDLVRAQILVALGDKLPWQQKELQAHGHTFEARLYAEDPTHQFVPVSGLIPHLELPQGPFRRFDFGYSSGDTLPSDYDAMLGKIITWAPNRAQNIVRLQSTLAQTQLLGLPSNLEFLKKVVASADFAKSQCDVQWIERHQSELVVPPKWTGELPPPPTQPSLSAPTYGRYQSPWQ